MFPIETWRSIFANLRTQPRADNTRDMLALASTCSAFQFEAEPILYHTVWLTRGIPQLITFVAAITRYRTMRAHAVCALHMQLPSQERERAEDVTKGILQQLPNLRSLYIDDLEDPHGVLTPSPFRLRTFGLDGDAFFCLHSEERRRLREGQAQDHTNAFRCHFLSDITTLTLVDMSMQLYNTLHKYCTPYNITHLNLISFPMRGHANIVHALAHKLVSLRISPAPYPTSSVQAWLNFYTSESWPTAVVKDHVFPRLEYLEVDEDRYDQVGPEEHLRATHAQLRPHPTTQLRATSAAEGPVLSQRWRSSCPAIRTFVWRPAPAFRSLAMDNQRYRDALQEFTQLLFEEWKTLRRFERARMEEQLVGVMDEEAATFIAFTRGEDRGVSTLPAEYDADQWHRV